MGGSGEVELATHEGGNGNGNDDGNGNGDGKKRASWGNKIEFILSVISFAVGLGNIWRFSFYLEKGGGGISWTFFHFQTHNSFHLLEGFPIH